MTSIDYAHRELLKFCMPGECSPEHHLEPFPVSFRTRNGMNTYKSATSFYVSSECQSLSICIKHIIVCTGKNKHGVLFQIVFGHNRRIARSIYFKSILITQL